ncbi:hypothetical protein OG21DRAFT_1511485 [Imleria badia]|nr:hypothetical protein OG21DRAFT_1511485 [Imleria badia]
MFKSLFALFLFATAVFAQSALIGLPTSNQTASAGNNLIVQVQRPNTLTGSEEVAVVIGLQSCPNSPCASPLSIMGTILYNGPFNPQYHEPYLPPYQNFTVQIPSSFTAGTALIGVAHVTLIGAGLYPDLETLNQAITIIG